MNRREFIKMAGKAVVGTMVGASAFSRAKAASEDYISITLKPEFMEWLEKQSSGIARLVDEESNIAFNVAIKRYPDAIIIKATKPIRGDYMAVFTSLLSRKALGPSRDNEVALSSYYDAEVLIPLKNGEPTNRAHLILEYKGNFWFNAMKWALLTMIGVGTLAYVIQGTPWQERLAEWERRFNEEARRFFSNLF